MPSMLDAILRKDFEMFCWKALAELDEDFSKEPYIRYLCARLEEFRTGKVRLMVVNQPPRSGKTLLCTVCLSGWILGHDPAAKIVIATNSEHLAGHITSKIRDILRASWYKTAFPARIKKDRSKLLDFETTANGAIFARPFGAQITGRGGDFIIVDDPLDIDDASNVEHIQHINERFDTRLRSRLDNQKKGRILIVAHRLNANDLSGHVLKQDGWEHVCLPLVASRTTSYGVGDDKWCRKKGDVLLPDAYSERDIEWRRNNSVNPDFETLYQQNPDGEAVWNIRKTHFRTFDPRNTPDQPIVVSIDPGQVGGPRNSRSVIQAWTRIGDTHFLVDQWREQANFSKLLRACRAFIMRYRPSAMLVENTGQGPALVAESPNRSWLEVVPVTPDRRNKAARLRDHLKTICSRKVWLPANAPWVPDFIAEFIDFPSGRFDDQIDAATQYLDHVGELVLEIPPKLAVGQGVNHRLVALPKLYASVQTRGGVLVRQRRW